MSRRLLILALTLAPAWPGGQAAAQAPDTPTADTSVVLLPEVLVRGSQPAATPGGAGSVTAKVESLAVRSVPTAEQILRALPGSYLRTNSRGEAEVTVRGSESRQVAILLDGVPLTFAWDGRADASVIPALAIEEVTLVRGLSTVVQGPNVLGGVVEFRSLVPGAARRAGAEVRGGVYQLGAFGLAGAVTVPREVGAGSFTMRAGGGYRETPGQTLPGDVEEPVPTDPDTRVNTDLEDLNGFVSMRLESDEGAYVSLLGVGNRAERGIAAALAVTDARFWRYPYIARGIAALSAGSGRHALPWGGDGEVQLMGGYDRYRTEIDAYDSRAYDTVVAEEDGDDEVMTLRTTLLQTLGGRGDVRLGLTYGDIHHDEILDGVSSRYRQQLWSGAAQGLIRIPGGGGVRDLDLTAGLAYDGADTPLSGDKPPLGTLERWGGHLGVTAHLGAGGTSVNASVSQRARFPSLRELYSGALGSYEPNPDLDPEQLRALEVGITSRSPGTSYQIVAFHHLLSDAVVRIRPPGGKFVRVNQEGIRSTGLEFMVSHAFGAIEASVDGVVQDVEVLDPDAGITEPENMPELMGDLRVQLPLGAGVLLSVDARYTGSQFAIDPERDVETELPPAEQLSFSLSRVWPLGGIGGFRTVQVRAGVDNVTDAVQYDAYGLPQPGRTALVEFRLH